MTPRLERRGFTLLEIVVVTGLMGLAVTLGFSVINRVLTTWRGISTVAELDATADRIFEKVGADLSNVVSPRLSGTGLIAVNGVMPGTSGGAGPRESDRIVLPVRARIGPDESDSAVRVMYKMERRNGRCPLVNTIGDFLTDIPIGGRVELAPDVDCLVFRVDFADESGDWVPRDDEGGWFKQTLPRAVRVSMVLADADFPYRQVSRTRIFPLHVR